MTCFAVLLHPYDGGLLSPWNSHISAVSPCCEAACCAHVNSCLCQLTGLMHLVVWTCPALAICTVDSSMSCLLCTLQQLPLPP